MRVSTRLAMMLSMLMMGIGTAAADTVPTPATVCPATVDAARFSSAEQLRERTQRVAGFGLRSTGSQAHERHITWLADALSRLPGVTIEEEAFEIERWQPTPMADDGVGRSLEKAARLTLAAAGETARELAVAGAVPYALPTHGGFSTGQLIHVRDPAEITRERVQGRIVIVDVPDVGMPYAALMMISPYFTNDLWSQTFKSYDRPFMWTDGALAGILIDAGSAGAAGVIIAFDVPAPQVAGYFDPHQGTHFAVPAVYVGVDEAIELKAAAARGDTAGIAIDAVRDQAHTRNLIARLPGLSSERIIFITNTDGNTWVQENSNAGLLALADYLSRLPLACRPRTFEFAFGSAHLHMSREGTAQYAEQVDRDYDDGDVAFAFAVEHLGTREIVPVERAAGPGRTLQFTGQGEVMAWFAGPSRALRQASINAIRHRRLDRIAVLPGQDLPRPSRSPSFCSFGGIGTYFHGSLIPTVAIISGPWSLWAPSFGEQAIDFERMRSQLLAIGDATLELAGKPTHEIAGRYTAERRRRARGATGCLFENPPERAPGLPPPGPAPNRPR